YERQDRAAIEPLRRLLAEGKRPQARLHALWSLKGLGALTDADLAVALSDSAPGVREHAMRLAEPRLDRSPGLPDTVLPLAAGAAGPRLGSRAAFTLGETGAARAAGALARIARRDAADRWTRTALLSSCAESADRLLEELIGDPAFASGEPGASLLEQLAVVVG